MADDAPERICPHASYTVNPCSVQCLNCGETAPVVGGVAQWGTWFAPEDAAPVTDAVRERLARLLLSVVFCNGERPYPWDTMGEEWRAIWRGKADAILASGPVGAATCPTCEHISGECMAAEQERDAARQKLAEAREVLRPFAEFPAASDTRLPPGMSMTQGSKFAAKQVIVADFWRARAFLATLEAEDAASPDPQPVGD